MKEIIVFFMDGKEYGVEISGMKSLESYQELTPVKDAPDCILGEVTIRDETYPVYDLKAKLAPSAAHVPAGRPTEEAKLLVLRTNVGSLACVVERVGKVFRAEGADIQSFPDVARSKETEYIDFVAKRNNELIVVINPKALLAEEEEESIKKLQSRKEKEL